MKYRSKLIIGLEDAIRAFNSNLMVFLSGASMSTVCISLLNYKDAQFLIRGYLKSVEWVIPASIYRLIAAYYPHKYNIYGIGSNEKGEFGFNHNKCITQYTKLKAFELTVDDYKDIYYGRCRFIVKTVDNHVRSIGSNHFGVSGSNSKRDFITSFTSIQPKDTFIRLISHGLTSNHSFIISSTNKIYAFGINDYYQWGSGKRSDGANRVPTLLGDGHRNIIKICTGLNHSLFLMRNGNVLACGKNIFGQCGIPKRGYEFGSQTISEPLLVSNLGKIMDIECGYMHNLCVDRKGKLFVFGYNRFGQLGIDGKSIIMPQQNEFFKNMQIVKICCGKSHSFVIDCNGKCWLFGNNLQGQIGVALVSENAMNIRIPHLFQLRDEKNKDLSDVIVIDGSCGYYHTVLLTKNKRIYAFGSNEQNAFSEELLDDASHVPHELTEKEIGIGSDEEIVRIIAGHQTTMFVTR